jgi:hypothetical protein
VKLEPIEFDKNRIIASAAGVSATMAHSGSTKRLRKTAHPSKTFKTSIQTSFICQLTKKTQEIEGEEPSNTIMNCTGDELYNLQQFDHIDEQENNTAHGIDMDKDTSIIHHHISSKRPPLSYTKRLQANARERERVHNLTAAFEALRQVIPIYGDQSKLSRLSILRIACSYVLVLGALNEIDFSQGENAYTLNESFHMLSYTILNELKQKITINNN